jgi:Lipocalin-like domain
MRPWIIIAAIVAASLCTSAFAQQKPLKDQLLGSWDLVSVTEDYGGNKVVKDPFGQSVKGSYSFDPSGRAMLMIIGDDLPTKPTKAQESSRLVVAWFGKYTVDDAAKTVTYTAERATIPAFDGHPRTASVTMTGDEFTQKSAPVNGPQGTFTPTLVFKRAK